MLGDIFTLFYRSQDGVVGYGQCPTDLGSSESLYNVLRIEAKLEQWKDTLPDFCKPGAAANYQSGPWYEHISLEATMLRNRYAPLIKTLQILLCD